jgi:hypothetical protein
MWSAVRIRRSVAARHEIPVGMQERSRPHPAASSAPLPTGHLGGASGVPPCQVQSGDCIRIPRTWEPPRSRITRRDDARREWARVDRSTGGFCQSPVAADEYTPGFWPAREVW